MTYTYSFRDKQHLVNLLAIGGLYVAVREVRQALTPTPDRQRAILDLGTSPVLFASPNSFPFVPAGYLLIDPPLLPR